MSFLSKHKSLSINISIIVVILLSVFFVKNIFIESKKNFTEIQNYWEWLLGDNSAISFNDIIWENFELFINDELIHKWNTLNSFNIKLNEILRVNGQKKIYVNIYNDNELIKTDIFKYSEFGYTVNIKWILNKIRNGIISSKWKISIELKDYLFFDNKLLNKKIDALKDIYTEDSNWEIFYNKTNHVFKVNSNKVFLSSVKDIKLNIAKVDTNINLRDSAIDIYMETKENVYFEQVKVLNKNLDNIKDKWVELSTSLEWINYLNIKKVFDNLDIWNISTSKWTNNFNISISKWFLVEHLQYNKTYNTIELDEKSFNEQFWNLWLLNIENKIDELREKPSIYSIVSWWLSENRPNINQFKILSYGNWMFFNYEWFKKEIKLFINRVFNNTDNLDVEISLKWLFVNNIDSNKTTVRVTNYDSILVNKNKFKLEKWLFYDNDYITEKYINYWKYPLAIDSSWKAYNSCEIINNIDLYCDSWEYIWKLWYNWNSIILKEPIEWIYKLLSNDFWLIKKNWNLVFNKKKVTIYIWWLYNNLVVFNKSENIIKEYKEELFPNFLWEYIEWTIVYDKVVFKVKKNSDVNAILVKSDTDLENNYVYLFNIWLDNNEE